VLSAATESDVTLVCAPPGSGKTALLRAWLADAGRSARAAWVSVGRDERDAGRFWRSVISELQASGGIAGPIPGATSPTWRGDEVIERLCVALERLADPLVLIIDDLHELRSVEASRQLETLLSDRRGRLQIVLATRRDPDLGLHRLRLAGRLVELRDAELRLAAGESRELLRSAGIELTDRSFEVLQQRTEGWAAGLRLAAMSLIGHPDPDRFVDEFSGSERTVADYLFAEVLDRQDPAVKRLLVRTSVLDRVNGQLAERLSGISGAERLLLELEAAGAFVSSLDSGRRWFRYHHLFADLLQLELRRTEPGHIAGLHLEAARWHAERGDVTEAVRHAQAAEDWELAAQLLVDSYHTLALNGESQTAFALLMAFPEEVRSTSAELAQVAALADLVVGPTGNAIAHLELAERLVDQLPQQRRFGAEVRLGFARVALAQRRADFATVMEVETALSDRWPSPNTGDLGLSNDARALALMYLGAAEAWSLRRTEAEQHLLASLEFARQIPRPFIEMACLGHLALLTVGRSLSEARTQSSAAVKIADANGWGSERSLAPALLVLTKIALWRGAYEDAEAWLDRAEKAVSSLTDPALGLLLHHCTAMLRSAQGRKDDAAAAFAAARRLHQHVADVDKLILVAESAALEAAALVRAGDLAQARDLLAGIPAAHQQLGEVVLAEARIDLAAGDPAGALVTLEPLLAGSCETMELVTPVEGYVLAANAHDQLSSKDSAAAMIEHALELAEVSEAVLPFAGEATSALLVRHPRHHTAHGEFAQRLTDILGGLPLADPATLDGTEELSESELRVLGYLASNLTAPEIARELFVSTNTVKTHMKHIYSKLGAHSRSAAVSQARGLGLFARR
jgi:LuxR family transcriptional regulator, maltose regulon positive regulatory protein